MQPTRMLFPPEYPTASTAAIFSTRSSRHCATPAEPEKDSQTPFLKATLGPLRFYAHSPPMEYTIGRAPDNDIVITEPSTGWTSEAL